MTDDITKGIIGQLHAAFMEGDLGNARYWYGQAQRPVPTKPLAAEWDAIAETLLAADA